jgi:uncharacterized membrane protein
MVLGIFNDRDNAEDAIEDLKDHGFKPEEISIVMRDSAAAHEVAEHTGANVAEGAVSGATTGGVVGAIAGLLVGIGAIAVPGIGGIFIAGPLAAALGLTGAAATTVSGAATGALAGGLIGALVSLGVPEEEARVYETGIKQGAILVAVPAMSHNEDDVVHLLQENGAERVKAVGAMA